MLKAKYVGGRDGVDLVLGGALVTVKRGETVDVPEAQAAGLLAGPWKPADKATTAWFKKLEAAEDAATDEADTSAESEA